MMSTPTSASTRRQELGMTLIELMVAIAVITILATILYPWIGCSIERGRMTRTLEDMRRAQHAVEIFEAEMGYFPSTLEEAFGEKQPPHRLIYCVDDPDGNRGHGNEICSFFDNDNPSGQNQHGGVPGLGFLLMTYEDLAPCADINFAFMSCCGQEPEMVHVGDNTKMGHPGNPQSGGGGGGGGGGGKGNK